MDRTDRPSCFLKYFDGETTRELDLERQSGEVFELKVELEMMVRCIRSGAAPIASGEDGFWSVAMCLAAQESVDRGEPVTFEDFLKE